MRQHTIASRRDEPLLIDGSQGEGGGQILRTALALSALTGRAMILNNVRARRARPGLAAQHLTAVRAMAEVCAARVEGDDLGSRALSFYPQRAPAAGNYAFDVGAARPGGSAGSAPLVLQAVLLPLAGSTGPSTVTVDGGTHLPQSPFIDYVQQIWQPLLTAMGVTAEVETVRTGWFPLGGGRIVARIAASQGAPRQPLALVDRGALRGVWGEAIAANLPRHIVERMADRARALLAGRGLAASIGERLEEAASPGAALFLAAEFERGRGGVCALGRRGKPAEEVAAEATAALLAFLDSGAAVDAHLGDQLLLPAVTAAGPSTVSVERVTSHLTTNAWVIERFGCARIRIEGRADGRGIVVIEPTPSRP